MKEKVKSKEFLMIASAIEPILQQEAFTLVDIEIRKEEDLFVTLFVYSKSDMGIDRIGKLNERVYDVLENIDFLKEGFLLEISSPGIFRKIKFINEFIIFTERQIKIMMENGDMVSGICKGICNDKVEIMLPDASITSLELSLIKKAALNG